MTKKYKRILESSQKQPSNSTTSSSNIVHERVTCDGCQVSPIRGIRYKCTVCPNFDYCEKCEETVQHDHVFMKIKTPFNYNGHLYGGHQGGHHGGHHRGGFKNHHSMRENKCNFFRNLLQPQNNNTQQQQTQQNPQESRCNFFKKLFQNQNNTQQPQTQQNQEIQKNQKEEKHTEKNADESGYDFLVKELKETYQLYQLDDKIILDALKKANGDVEKAMTILFA